MSAHVPVLLDEALAALNLKPDGVYLDATGGLGGHSREIAARLDGRGRLLVCDYHEGTAAGLKELFRADPRVSVKRSRFSRVFDALEAPFDAGFDGILADFGISSAQLDDPALGIGFQLDGAPLDMRLDGRLKMTAADFLAESSRDELADLFYRLGGERHSRVMGAAIAGDRERGVFYRTTDELRGLCERVLGRRYRGKKIHPATKVFQALRIAVNGELDEVREFLAVAPGKLKVSGRLVVISFHEGEDGLAKAKFRELASSEGFFLPVRKAVKPGEAEIAANPRSRSARLRILERGCGALKKEKRL